VADVREEEEEGTNEIEGERMMGPSILVGHSSETSPSDASGDGCNASIFYSEPHPQLHLDGTMTTTKPPVRSSHDLLSDSQRFCEPSDHSHQQHWHELFQRQQEEVEHRQQPYSGTNPIAHPKDEPIDYVWPYADPSRPSRSKRKLDYTYYDRAREGAQGGAGAGRSGGDGGRGGYPDYLSVHGGLQVEGIVRAQGFLQYSDLRLKTDVEDIVDAVSLISKLEGKRYRWKGSQEIERMGGHGKAPIMTPDERGLQVIGLIAQQVQKVLPEAVHEDEHGFLSIDYVEIIPVLVEAFNQHLEAYHRQQKELKSEFDDWRRLLGDIPGTDGGEGVTRTQKQHLEKKEGKSRTRGRPSAGLEVVQHASDEDPDSFDVSTENTTATDTEEFDGDDHNDEQEEEEEERPPVLVVDLDRLVADRTHLATLSAQMNKLIPDRQYTELLKFVLEQKKKDSRRNRRLLFLFVITCFLLFAINVAVSIGVPMGITFLHS